MEPSVHFRFLLMILFLIAGYANLLETGEGDEEDEEMTSRSSWNISELTRNNHNICCSRHPKLEAIGFGIGGEVVYVDVGHCPRHCSNDGPEQQDSINLLSDFHSPGTSVRSCSRHSRCSPSSVRRESRSMIGAGQREVTVVSECQCYQHGHSCGRFNKMITFFPQSPFETTVDVGVCVGRCEGGGGDKCRPLYNRTQSVNGPNGPTCVEVIHECSCVPDCYRMKKMEVYWNSIHNQSDSDQPTNQIKEIDVGVCVGVCSSERKYKCVLRDSTNSSVCLMSLTERPEVCFPTSYTSHSVTDGRKVVAITQCGCS